MSKLVHVLFAYSVIQGLVFSMLIIRKYKGALSEYLSAISLIFSLLIAICLLYWTGNFHVIPIWLRFPLLATYLIGPLFFGMFNNRRLSELFRFPSVLHFLPFVLAYFWMVLRPIDSTIINLATEVIQMTHLVIYLILVGISWYRSKNQSYARWVFVCYAGFTLMYFAYEIMVVTSTLTLVFDYMVCLFMSAFILTLMFKSYFNDDFDFKLEKKKILSQSMADAIGRSVINHLKEQRAFLNGDYKITDLSTELGYSVHQVSEALNTKYNGYYHTIHSLRIEEAKKLLSKGDLSVIQVAYASGYNNKVSFYKTFKKLTGITPKEWQSRIDIQQTLVS